MNHPLDREVVVFSAARRLPAGERGAYLDETCAGDATLRGRVDELLRASDEAGAFLQLPAPGAQRPAEPLTSPDTLHNASAPGEKAGDRIGRYKLLQQIGEGGCGVVYMAEQEEPVRRRVALKVIKLGMATKSVIARFEAERQALALMDHPNIAKVLDAGATETGRPYFVMELVRGIKITAYSDQNNLSTRQRLELFVQVCQAVQHAHQKGVIHRDLKPSNVLVTSRDGVAAPKVIDFGIAKATTDQPLTDKTLFTAFEQFIGTPAYMSPEQAEMSELGIDTRSDIYSLGVLLYELLTGQTPFDAKELLSAGLDAMRRTIREVEPVKPSTRLTQDLVAADVRRLKHSVHQPSTIDHQPNEVRDSSRRLLQTKDLIHALRGDLDWIVMKCLEKDRSRRYETANGLARDVERHLADEPVVACPPSGFYRFQKMVRRHKLAFAAAGAVLTALLIGFAVSTWLLVKEAEARRLAVAAETKAQTEAAKSQQVAQFLKGMLQGVRPSKALGRDTTMLREILDQTAGRVGKDLTNQPEVEVEVRLTLASTYDELGFYQPMEQMARQSLQLARSRLGEENESVANSLSSLGDALMHLGNLPAAETYCREALAMRRKLFGNQHRAVAGSLNNLALVLEEQGRLAEAEIMQRDALAIEKRLFGDEHLEVAGSLGNLASLLAEQDRPAEAEVMLREALAMERKLGGEDHPAVAQSLASLANLLRQQGRLADVESMQREALASRIKLFGADHIEVANSLGNLANVLLEQGNLPEAETLQRQALAMDRKLLGNDHPAVADLLNNLANVLDEQGKVAEAETIQREALALQRKLLGDDHPKVAGSLHNLAKLAAGDGRLFQAEILHREALMMRRNLFGNEHSAVADSLDHLMRVLFCQGKYGDAGAVVSEVLSGAETMQPEALARLKSILDTETIVAGSPLNFLARVLQYQGEFAAAETLCRGQLILRRRLLGNEHAEVAESLANLANVLEAQGKIADAEVLVREALVIRRKLPGNQDSPVADALGHLLNLLMKERKYGDVEQLFRELLPAAVASQPQSAGLLRSRAEFFARRGRWGEAVADLTRALELNPSEHFNYHMLAPLLLTSGQLENYRSLCQRVLERFGGTNNPISAVKMARSVVEAGSWLARPYREPGGDPVLLVAWGIEEGDAVNVAERMAKACLILPSTGVVLKAASDLADSALSVVTTGGHSDPPWFQVTKGLADFRRGDYEGAVKWTRKALEDSLPNRDAEAYMVMAMAHYHMKQIREARSAFARGLETVDAKMDRIESGDLTENWNDWIIAHALTEEARALIPPDDQGMAEVPIADVGDQDQQPWEAYWGSTWSQHTASLTNSVKEVPGAGDGGTIGLVLATDGSALANGPNSAWAGFGLNMEVLADSTSGVDTTNLDLYKLYATVRTAGITGSSSHGFVQWKFIAPSGIILTMEREATFTTNYQTYSFVLGDVRSSPYGGGSWSQFATNFDQVIKVGCTVIADRWLGDYGADADNALYLGHVKFVRLVPKENGLNTAKPLTEEGSEPDGEWKQRLALAQAAAEAARRRRSGSDYAQHGRFAKAANDFARVIELRPRDHEVWHWQAATFLHSRQLDAYREICRRSMAQFENTTDPNTAERIAKDFLMLPCSGAGLEMAAQMAETAVSAPENHPDMTWFRFVKGLAEYRSGRFATASEWMQKVLSDVKHDLRRDAEASMVLAMAQHQLNQTDQARSTFAQGLEIVSRKLPGLDSDDLGVGWIDWVFAHALLEEASALIQPSPIVSKE